jgi:DNA-directed RNA polymerase specialized sigma24 family protein
VSADRSLLAGADEAQLLTGVSAGDLSCLQELYRRHGRAVLDVALRLSPDRDEAEAVASEAFLHVWDHPDVLAASEDPVLEHLLDYVRREFTGAAQRGSSAEPGLLEPAASRQPGPSLDDPALDTDERLALELAVQGATYTEIAESLGQPPDVVMGWLTSGLRKLAE